MGNHKYEIYMIYHFEIFTGRAPASEELDRAAICQEHFRARGLQLIRLMAYPLEKAKLRCYQT